jgi:DNA-directed RNA polymerase subunit M/transcription elongation factor TFIIS
MEPPKTKTEAECDCGEIAEWSSYTQNEENDYEEIYFYCTNCGNGFENGYFY